MAAGQYSTRFEWFQFALGEADSFGQRADSFNSQGFLWGALEDVATGEAEKLTRQTATLTATIRLRNYPELAARDALDDADGTRWFVHAVRYGENETVCEVEES